MRPITVLAYCVVFLSPLIMSVSAHKEATAMVFIAQALALIAVTLAAKVQE